MFARFFTYLVFHWLAALAGWLLARALGMDTVSALLGALVGLIAGGFAWLLIDLLRAARLFKWLKTGLSSGEGVGVGLWGEVFERVRRQLRVREQQTQASETRLADFLAALQASPNGVVLLDPDSRIEWFNQTAASHFGFERERDLSQHIGNLVRDPGFATYLANRDFSRDVIMPGNANSPSRPVKLATHLHPYAQGRFLLLSRDITSVEQAEVMRRDFVANVSHEIRTPLTVLSGFVETLQSLPLDAKESARYLDLMAQQAHRMQTLVSDLLILSRLEGSPAVGTTDWVLLPPLLRQVVEEAQALAVILHPAPSARHVISLVMVQPSEVAGSHSELLSAMTNLASNAVRHTPAGGNIELKWDVLADGRGEFSVVDTGPGIAAEHIPRLTERFYRIDHSRSRETGGTGLGLAIVKHVVQRHGAQLSIESASGKAPVKAPSRGSRFTITFPAHRVRASAKLGGAIPAEARV
jgi:two-component system, OmpR family, phosphate regulon sensor histidine kinase PhoR